MKKSVNKILSVLISITLFASCCGLFSGFAANDANGNLSFNADGSFKIMQVADIQDGDFMMPVTLDFIKRSIKAEKPDLIVLTGDNIQGSAAKTGNKKIDLIRAKNAINKFMSAFEEAGIPVAAVFGNHDDEGIITKEEQMAIYESYSCFVGYDEGDSLSGCGTYSVPIYSSTDASKVSYNLWMIDSGTYDEENGGYDHVKQDQLDWYVQKSNELKENNGGEVVHSMMFQHIVVPEIYDALVEVDENYEGAVEKNGKYYILPETNKAGYLHEAPCPATINGGEFQTVKAQGDVVAMFFGHDHTNSYEIPYQGVDLVCTCGCGFQSYGDETRGVRIINLDEKDTSTYETHMFTFLEQFDDYESQAHFNMWASEVNIGKKLASWIAYPLIKIIETIFFCAV